MRDIGHAFEKIEVGLSRYINNDEALAVVEQIKQKIAISKFRILLIHHGECNYRAGDRFQGIPLEVTPIALEQIPGDIAEQCSRSDIVVFAVYQTVESLDREFKDYVRELSRGLNNSCLAMKEEVKRDASAMVSIKRQRGFVVEDRRDDLNSVLKQLNEETPLETFGLAQKKDEIMDQFELLDFAIREICQNAVAKNIINAGEFIEIQIGDVRVLSKQLSVLKSKLQRSFKVLSYDLDQDNDQFFGISSPQIKAIRSKIEEFEGFRQEDIGKNTFVRLTDGFQEDIFNEIETHTAAYLKKQIEVSASALSEIRVELDQALESIDINYKIGKEEPLPGSTSGRIFESVAKGNKQLERSYSKKGMYQLFMELRTPMFMLMPLIMVAMLFKPVLGLFDKIGKVEFIDRAKVELNGRPTIKVVGHPRYKKMTEIYEALREDIENDINGRDIKESPFYVQGNLAIQYTELEENKKSTRKPTIIPEEDAVYVMLTTDRDVILPRFEEEFLTTAQKRSSSSAGMGAIIKFIQNVPHSEYVVLGLIFLVVWYVRLKLREFNKEEEIDAADARKTIKYNFISDVDRYVSSVQGRWKNILDNWVRNQQDRFVAELEYSINQKIDQETKKVQELKVLFDKRAKNFKDSEKELRDYQNELKKIKQDMLQLVRL